MSDPILFAGYIVGMAAMLFALVETKRRRGAERNSVALTNRLIKQRKRIDKLADRLLAVDNCGIGREAVDAIKLLMPLVSYGYRSRVALDAGNAVLTADRRWHEVHADTVAGEIKANEGR